MAKYGQKFQKKENNMNNETKVPCVIVGQLGAGLLGEGDTLDEALADAECAGFRNLSPRRYYPGTHVDGDIVWTDSPEEFRDIDCDL